MIEMPNVLGYLKHAADPKNGLRDGARRELMSLIENGLLGDQGQKETLRLSDLGSCRLEAYGKRHGMSDVPIDVIDLQLTRFDEGSLNGAWYGCLIAAAARADGWNVNLEEDIQFAGVGGHADVRMFRDYADGEQTMPWHRSHIVEVKTNYDYKQIANPEKEALFQLKQAASYCHADDDTQKSQSFTMLMLAPGAPKNGPRAKQYHFLADPYHSMVAADIIRLSAAIKADAPPVGDPVEPWRCATCSVSACKRNKNRNANNADALLA